MMRNWFEAHNFPYIVKENGSVFWQTEVATGEMLSDGTIIWHDKDFFEKVKREENAV